MSDTEEPVTRIVHLARRISGATGKLDRQLTARCLPTPSFDENALSGSLPSDLEEYRNVILDATAELHDLLLEPLHLVKSHSAAIARYDIANLIPPGEQVSFTHLGNKTGLGEEMVRRLLRYAMTMRIFRESEPGMVAHTQASRLLASPQMTAWMQIGTEEMWPAATKMLDALEKWPQSSEPNETGFTLSQNSNQSIYDIIGGSPERGARFATAMGVWATRPDYSPSHAVQGYNWSSLSSSNDDDRVRVVDLGGARGHIAAAIALQYPNIDFIVQDMDKVIEGAEFELPQHLVSERRVQFMSHDLFAPQTVHAQAIFLRWILHNWSDKHCISILRAQIPALAPDSRIIIMESCMPDPGNDSHGDIDIKPLWKEKDLRAEDLNMGAVFNSKERTLAEWGALLTEADPRFTLISVSNPGGSALAVIEVLWAESI